jgi:hypothetical protein
MLFRPNWRTRQSINIRNGPKIQALNAHLPCVSLHVRHGDVLLPKYYYHDHRASFNISLLRYVDEAVEVMLRVRQTQIHDHSSRRMHMFLMTDDADISSSIRSVVDVRPNVRIHQARTVRPLMSLSTMVRSNKNDFNYLSGLGKDSMHDELVSFFEAFELAAQCAIWVGNCRSSFAVLMVTHIVAYGSRREKLLVSDFGRGGPCNLLARNTNAVLRRRCQSGDNPCSSTKNDRIGTQALSRRALAVNPTWRLCDAGPGPQQCTYMEERQLRAGSTMPGQSAKL